MVVLQEWMLLVGAFVLGVAAQGSKICVDTIVQASIDDAYRGRVFSFYDVCSTCVRLGRGVRRRSRCPRRQLPAVFAVVAVGYAVTALVFGRASRGPATSRSANPATNPLPEQFGPRGEHVVDSPSPDTPWEWCVGVQSGAVSR